MTGDETAASRGAVVSFGTFPDDHPGGPERVRTAWEVSGLLPTPRRALGCPFCDGVLAVKDWKFHRRTRVGSSSPWRCDVRMKCMTCGFVPTFGVLVTREVYQRATRQLGAGHWIHWRAGREAMEEVDRGEPGNNC
ncbi:MAG TPA: hypothetical protein VFO98_04495 [Marmoricola sp.]|nr:hypothetical protein [Marmoricola sp.]